MTASRACRLLGCVLLAGGALLLSPRTRPATSAEADAPPHATVLFDSIVVFNPVFAPDTNGVGVVFRYYFSIADSESIHVFIHMSPTGRSDTIDVVQDIVWAEPRVFHEAEWTGIVDDVVQPEGDYTAHFRGTVFSGVPTGRVLSNQRQVRIDVTPPQVEILDVDPRSYTPTLPIHESVVPEIRLRVSQSRLEDVVGVYVLDSQSFVRDSLGVSGGFNGDGEYLVRCESCAGVELEDGLYTLQAFGNDAAGNSTTSVDSLDKNIEGPQIDLTHPPGSSLVFQFADSLVGIVSDRQVVDSLTLVVVGADSTDMVLTPRGGVPAPEVEFFVDVSTLLQPEGVYEVQLQAQDADGVSDSLEVTITIDRTPPRPPRLQPPLPDETVSQTIQASVVFDDADVVGLDVSGGADPPQRIAVPDPTLPIPFTRTLNPGSNTLRLEALDRAQNLSAATVANVAFTTSVGVTAPERFRAGQSIEVNVGDDPASSVTVRVLALDGSLVHIFQGASNQVVYTFTWDLLTAEGRRVKNGAYLLHVNVVYPGGSRATFRKMIAVVE
ncbi:MAG: hypothetical protein JSW67_03740 [Candidatus Latescibacterota bacterium]|nr:MAG: hypothetical protein JSW67_03740 [Candidatus Latescibacterota bacterium]